MLRISSDAMVSWNFGGQQGCVPVPKRPALEDEWQPRAIVQVANGVLGTQECSHCHQAKGHCVGALLDMGLDGAVFGVIEVDGMLVRD
eukprot:scaffold118012_cov40-Cyclotella_meneghiniana.AAC.1